MPRREPKWGATMLRTPRALGRTRSARVALGALASALLTVSSNGTAQAATHDRHSGIDVMVVVRATPGHIAQARADVTRLAGSVSTQLPKINGFVARIPLRAFAGLQHAPGVASVTRTGSVILG